MDNNDLVDILKALIKFYGEDKACEKFVKLVAELAKVPAIISTPISEPPYPKITWYDTSTASPLTSATYTSDPIKKFKINKELIRAPCFYVK